MEIVYGNLEYVSVDSMKEYSWAKEAFDGIKVDFDKSTFNEENNEEDKNGLKVNNASESENLKIYGNSVQDGTPSIDAPVEIKSVGDKTNNIIDFSKYTWTKMNGNNCNYEFDNNTFSIERTAENNGVGIFANIELQAGTYTISISDISGNTTYEDGTYFIYFNYSSISSTVKKSDGFKKSFTLTEDSVGQIYLYLPDSTDKKIGNKIKYNVQLEKGKDATAYEPYGYYKIPVTVSGKNLLPYPYVNTTKTINGVTFVDNGDGTITVSGIPTASISYYLGQVPVQTGTSYALSGIDLGKNLIFVLLEYDENGTKIKQENSRSISYKASDNASYIRIYIDRINSNTEIPETVVKPQLEIGSSYTKYEPYFEPFMTNIYLNEPLRKVGDAVDYIDFKNKKVVRNIKEIVLNGKEEWSNMSGNAPYKLTLNDRENEYKNNLRIMSNFFETVNNSISWVGYDSMISVSSMYPKDIVFRYTKIDSLENFKSYLNNNSPKLLYVLSSSEEKILNLPEISTINGINNVSIGTSITPSKMEVIYGK